MRPKQSTRAHSVKQEFLIAQTQMSKSEQEERNRTIMNSECTTPNLLDRYIDGHLSDSEKEQVEAHLAECPRCLEAFALGKMLSDEQISAEYDQEAQDMVWGAYRKVKEGLEKDKLPKKHIRSSDTRKDKKGTSFLARSYGRSYEKIRAGMERLGWIPDPQAPGWISGYDLSPSAARSSTPPQASAPCGSVFIKKKMDDLRTEIYLEKTAKDNVCLWINVLKENRVAKQVFLTLERRGDHPFSRSQTLAGGFQVFENLPFGTYHLILEYEDQEMGDCLFEIDDEGFREMADR